MSYMDNIQYLIADPTGNITILVLDPVPAADQPAVAAALMQREPAAEQVGFLSWPDGDAGTYDIALRMAGGEFCGNASMSAAAFCVMQKGSECGEITLRVSGTDAPVTVSIDSAEEPRTWTGQVHMPDPQKIEMTAFPDGKEYPVVTFDGITHVIIQEDNLNALALQNDDSAETALNEDVSNKTTLQEETSKIFPTSLQKAHAEKHAREWCSFLHADALGILFLNAAADHLTPLVYVPGADTLFWETSCGSGSAAAGAWLARKAGHTLSVKLQQPGGTLKITASPGGPILLKGRVHFI